MISQLLILLLEHLVAHVEEVNTPAAELDIIEENKVDLEDLEDKDYIEEEEEEEIEQEEEEKEVSVDEESEAEEASEDEDSDDEEDVRPRRLSFDKMVKKKPARRG